MAAVNDNLYREMFCTLTRRRKNKRSSEEDSVEPVIERDTHIQTL